MNSKQIESIFTAKVTEYIANGYMFNLATMRGSQGEIGKVDLRKGSEVIRLVLEEDYDSRLDTDMLVLTVGRVEMERPKKNPFSSFETIWNNRMEVIERVEWYKVSRRSDFYVDTREAMQEILTKQDKRFENRHVPFKVCNHNREEALEVVLRFIRQKPRCSRKKVSDIADVHRSRNSGKLCYTVYLKDGKIFTIK